MTASTFAVLCNYHLYLNSRTFHHPKKNHFTIPACPSPISSLCPGLLGTTILLSVSVDFLIPDILFHINGNVQYVTFYVCLISLSMMFFKVYPSSMYQYFIPFMAKWYLIVWISISVSLSLYTHTYTYTLYLSFDWLMETSVVSFFGCCESSFYYYLCTSLVWTCFYFSKIHTLEWNCWVW